MHFLTIICILFTYGVNFRRRRSRSSSGSADSRKRDTRKRDDRREYIDMKVNTRRDSTKRSFKPIASI